MRNFFATLIIFAFVAILLPFAPVDASTNTDNAENYTTYDLSIRLIFKDEDVHKMGIEEYQDFSFTLQDANNKQYISATFDVEDHCYYATKAIDELNWEEVFSDFNPSADNFNFYLAGTDPEQPDVITIKGLKPGNYFLCNEYTGGGYGYPVTRNVLIDLTDFNYSVKHITLDYGNSFETDCANMEKALKEREIEDFWWLVKYCSVCVIFIGPPVILLLHRRQRMKRSNS